MKKTFVSLFAVIIFLSSCKKENLFEPPDIPQSIAIPLPCLSQKDNPAGRTYDIDSLISFQCANKHCGIIPLSSKNYWVYEDSVFNNGTFVKVQYDTLRYSSNKKSLSDDLIWWESSLYTGIPQVLYANDSALFSIQQKLYNAEYVDVKKEYSLFAGDSIRYLASFDDIAATGRSLKMKAVLTTQAGDFDEYIYFEKNARNYRKDQVYFKPGIGVLKYIQEKAPFGTRVIKLQNIMTLVSYHIE